MNSHPRRAVIPVHTATLIWRQGSNGEGWVLGLGTFRHSKFLTVQRGENGSSMSGTPRRYRTWLLSLTSGREIGLVLLAARHVTRLAFGYA